MTYYWCVSNLIPTKPKKLESGLLHNNFVTRKRERGQHFGMEDLKIIEWKKMVIFSNF